MAIDEEYRSYREVIAGAIGAVRPRFEVATAGVEALDEEVKRFDPHLVICNLPPASVERIAWVELSLDPIRPSVVRVGGRCTEVRNPVLDTLLEVIDQVEDVIGTDDILGDDQVLPIKSLEES
ncbi:MAG TPA: hypothetical protein VFI90_07890 [Rubrobacter sp.]|nr:hypothetical protein [Rubrobacter sp.]